jgi:hypothetical protein
MHVLQPDFLGNPLMPPGIHATGSGIGPLLIPLALGRRRRLRI